MPEGRASTTHDIGFALAEPLAARRSFDRATDTFDSASFVHDRAREILCERLGLLSRAPQVILDLGCGTGASARALSARFPGSTVVALDSSANMCARTQSKADAKPIVADAAHVPLATGCIDLVFANLVLPSCRPEIVFAEVERVLAPGGLFLFATLGPATLQELRDAWRQVDSAIHVHVSFEPQMIGDWLARAGLAEPVVDVDRVTLSYRDVAQIHADLRASGGRNVAGGRRRTLTGARRFAGYAKALAATAVDGRIRVTCELILGAAWGRARSERARREPREAFAVPVASIKRRSLS